MNGRDLDSFVDYLGVDNDMVWNVAELVADALVFDNGSLRPAKVRFQAVCLYLLEEDAHLDLYGCLDAPL